MVLFFLVFFLLYFIVFGSAWFGQYPGISARQEIAWPLDMVSYCRHSHITVRWLAHAHHRKERGGGVLDKVLPS